MGNKLGENEPCICGSNRKYNKCCMNKDLLPDFEKILDFSWHKLRKTEGEVVNQHLIPYFRDNLPEKVMVLALADFYSGGIPEGIDRDLIFDTMFIPWLLFNWVAKESFGVDQFDPQKTIAENYLNSYRQNLSNIVINFLEAINQSYYSFYSIQEIILGKALIVRDILLGEEHSIKEKIATRSVKRGDIVFGRILQIDNQAIFVGIAPYIIPIEYNQDLLDYKMYLSVNNELRTITPELLRECSSGEFINYFFEIIGSYINKTPKLYNGDGDPIVYSKSYFKITLPPFEFLQMLLPLTLSNNYDEFLGDAQRNSSGDIIKIAFPWLAKGNKKTKQRDNTVMGNILVEENRLVLETNSKKRNEKGIQLLKKYLDKEIEFQSTVSTTPEQELKITPNINYNDNNRNHNRNNGIII